VWLLTCMSRMILYLLRQSGTYVGQVSTIFSTEEDFSVEKKFGVFSW